MNPTSDQIETVVIGGGQAGLAAGYYLKQAGIPFVILEANSRAVGSWPHYYESLKLFSPRRYSGLPGLQFPGQPDGFPNRDEVINYLESYRDTFDLPVQTDTRVENVEQAEGSGRFRLTLSRDRHIACRSLIVASGPHNLPVVPPYPDADQYRGRILHSYDYVDPSSLGITGASGRTRVVVVGSKNSAVQIAYELAPLCQVTLASRKRVRFINQSTCGLNIYWWERHLGLDRIPLGISASLSRKMMRMGGVIDDGTYRDAMKNGTVVRREMFVKFYPHGVQWSCGERQEIDAVIFATGYRPNVEYLESLPGALDIEGMPRHRMGVSPIAGLYYMGLVGMRNIASATLRGVDADAKAIVRKLEKATSTI